MTLWKVVASLANAPRIRAGSPQARRGRPGGTRPNPVMTRSVNAIGKCRLAEAARTPRDAAAAAAAAAATAAAATAAAAPGLFDAERLGVFLVEDIEGRQAHVGNLFLAKRDRQRRQVRRRDIRRCDSRRGCATARHRQGHSGKSQHGYGFTATFWFRSALRLRHSSVPPAFSLAQMLHELASSVALSGWAEQRPAGQRHGGVGGGFAWAGGRSPGSIRAARPPARSGTRPCGCWRRAPRPRG